MLGSCCALDLGEACTDEPACALQLNVEFARDRSVAEVPQRLGDAELAFYCSECAEREFGGEKAV